MLIFYNGIHTQGVITNQLTLHPYGKSKSGKFIGKGGYIFGFCVIERNSYRLGQCSESGYQSINAMLNLWPYEEVSSFFLKNVFVKLIQFFQAYSITFHGRRSDQWMWRSSNLFNQLEFVWSVSSRFSSMILLFHYLLSQYLFLVPTLDGKIHT